MGMIEQAGDIWLVPADALCIPTNGFVNSHGHGVMGRGLALQAAKKYPKLPAALGTHIHNSGNHVGIIKAYRIDQPINYIVAFPVKYRYDYPAVPKLIRQSCEELCVLAAEFKWQRITLPRVGCGNGGLLWSNVRPILLEFLDDRFLIVDLARAG